MADNAEIMQVTQEHEEGQILDVEPIVAKESNDSPIQVDSAVAATVDDGALAVSDNAIVDVTLTTPDNAAVDVSLSAPNTVADIVKPVNTKKRAPTPMYTEAENVVRCQKVLQAKKRKPSRPISDRMIDNFIAKRCATNGHVWDHLFKFEVCEQLDGYGTFRFEDCTLQSSIGPHQAGTHVRFIDWFSMGSTLLLNIDGSNESISAFQVKFIDAVQIPITLA